MLLQMSNYVYRGILGAKSFAASPGAKCAIHMLVKDGMNTLEPTSS